MQENITASTEENTRLSRSIEADRMVASELRTANEEMKIKLDSTTRKTEQLVLDKNLMITEKDAANEELRAEMKRLKKSLSLNIMKNMFKVNEMRRSKKILSAMKQAVDVKKKVEGEAVLEKIKGEYLEVLGKLKGTEEKIESLEMGGEELKGKMKEMEEEEEGLKKELKEVQEKIIVPAEVNESYTQMTPRNAVVIETQTSPRKQAERAGGFWEESEGAKGEDEVEKGVDSYEIDEDSEGEGEGGVGVGVGVGTGVEVEVEVDVEVATAPTPASVPATPNQGTPEGKSSQSTNFTSPDPRTVKVPTTDSDVINSTIISLRATLQEQDDDMDAMKRELDSLRVEKNVAIEQAGIAKLEALQLVAKLEVRRSNGSELPNVALFTIN